jgi:hypothetical protein
MATRRTSRSAKPKKGHPLEAMDTDIPGDSVNEDAWKALVENYEGDPVFDTEGDSGD